MASPRKKWLRMKAREDAILAAATIEVPITTIIAAETTTPVAPTIAKTTTKTRTRARRGRIAKKD